MRGRVRRTVYRDAATWQLCGTLESRGIDFLHLNSCVSVAYDPVDNKCRTNAVDQSFHKHCFFSWVGAEHCHDLADLACLVQWTALPPPFYHLGPTWCSPHAGTACCSNSLISCWPGRIKATHRSYSTLALNERSVLTHSMLFTLIAIVSAV